ncbi:glutamate racemase [Psychroflexus sp. S27]|uniref:glutamate racemase n=1 Tax=Psychroflexus sp. S27 TaxID=1982757 RepID=UPI0026915FCE|nr:glutamate racemase [Psychroflexus sp. S27]
MSIKDFPIGVFDSGVGGTSILKELMKALPHERFIYLADSKNAPYGTKPVDEIIELSQKNTTHLISKKVKLIVVACNTATTNAISILRENHQLPFIGIEPAIKPAALQTKSNSIGILATKGTLSSALFEKASELFKKDINITEVEGKEIVEAVENGKTENKDFQENLKNQVEVFKENAIDCLVLGCTHYPYIKKDLKNLLPGIKIIDSGYAVAKQTKKILIENKILQDKPKKQIVDIYTNANNLKVIDQIFKNQTKVNCQFLDF